MKKAKAKKADIALIIAFCAALGALFLLLLVLPKHAGELSQLEFRSLASYPFRGKSAETIAGEFAKGEAAKNVDSFLEDHFPGRSFFIALNSYSTRLSGRNADQGVVRGRSGRLFDAPLDIDLERADKNVAKIDEFASANGLDSYIVIVPSAAVECVNTLPALHLDYHDGELIARVKENSSSKVIDLLQVYSFEKDKGSLFYRTDHHWTMAGAYLCYVKLCSEMGITPVPREYFAVDKYEFYGSFYREAGLWLTKPDTLEIWRNGFLDTVNVTVGCGENAVTHTGAYDETKLQPDQVDKYAAYLYSNNAVTFIENPGGNGETLILVKDSYGNSIAPLLAVSFSRVIMIDTRYYRDPTLPTPSELAAEYGASRLVVVFGSESMVTDPQIALLR